MEIQELLEERKRMSLQELAAHFDSTPEAIEPMMDRLVRKGRVRVLDAEACGKSCKACFCAERAQMIVYITNGRNEE